MKVLLYTEYFFPITGGIQTIVYELACGLVEYSRNQATEPGIEVVVVTRTRETTSNDKSWPFHLVRAPSASKLFQLIRNADVVHLAGPALLPMLWSLILRKRVIVTHHGYQSVCPNGLLLTTADRKVCPGHFMAHHYGECARCKARDIGWAASIRSVLLMFPRRALSKLVSANVAVTNHVAQRIALPRTTTILHGIRDRGAAVYPQNGDCLQLGYIGRLVEEKGLPLLFEAAKRLKEDGYDFRLTIVGDGPLRAQLERASVGLGLFGLVTFTGELHGADLDRAVRPIQVAVMPSVCEETAGLTAIEQMMRGGVVIASDIGGLGETISAGGMKFAPGDANALYTSLRDIFEHRAELTSLGVQARARALKMFNRDGMIQVHAALYREDINDQPPPAQ